MTSLAARTCLSHSGYILVLALPCLYVLFLLLCEGLLSCVLLTAQSLPGSYQRHTVQPNKVYIGGLPEHTRKEDLQSCFGKLGTIVNIELK